MNLQILQSLVLVKAHELISKWIDLIDIDIQEMVKCTEGSLKHSIKFTKFLSKW